MEQLLSDIDSTLRGPLLHEEGLPGLIVVRFSGDQCFGAAPDEAVGA
ncbi:hypothetical protein PV458_31125 [Streptomyces sp. MN03-5084-2B]|nr:hypothetical protein [Streptomyces sp. MN03-5084-2B]